MTKAAQIADLQYRLAQEQAKQPLIIAPDISIPSGGYNKLTRGWLFTVFTGYGENGRVYKACSSSVGHGDGWEKTTSQNGVRLYSTELKATQALRQSFARKYEESLNKIDARIVELTGELEARIAGLEK